MIRLQLLITPNVPSLGLDLIGIFFYLFIYSNTLVQGGGYKYLYYYGIWVDNFISVLIWYGTSN